MVSYGFYPLVKLLTWCPEMSIFKLGRSLSAATQSIPPIINDDVATLK